MMKKKLLFATLLVFAACNHNDLKPFPKVEYGTILEESPLENSTFYWVPNYAAKDPYEEPILKALNKKPVCVSADDYGKILKYVDYLKVQAEKRCTK